MKQLIQSSRCMYMYYLFYSVEDIGHQSAVVTRETVQCWSAGLLHLSDFKMESLQLLHLALCR